ncbi:MAG TPA: response regulator transcription factor [Candidatus Dormibacteraeota bacterium]|jgi:two-component system OmpR family response regulator|nr:response regulator transcription factor [Candidatus Dormibacteraeota bacterium]
MRVLVVDDDVQLAAALRRGLEEAGFSVDLAGSGDAAVAAASATPFDLLVLDVMLPGRNGLEVCRELRHARVHTPILMLTARDTVADRIQGLDAGADDYLVKPFAFGELVARLRALGRRHLPDRTAVLEAGDIRLDTARRTVTVAGRSVDLRAKELAVLEYFMLNPGQLLTRLQVEEHVWNYDFRGESNLVEAYVARIRRKLTHAGGADPFVTVRGAGYRFEPSACPAS